MQASHGWLQGLQKQDVSMQASHGWLQGLQKQDVSMQASHGWLQGLQKQDVFPTRGQMYAGQPFIIHRNRMYGFGTVPGKFYGKFKNFF